MVYNKVQYLATVCMIGNPFLDLNEIKRTDNMKIKERVFLIGGGTGQFHKKLECILYEIFPVSL